MNILIVLEVNSLVRECFFSTLVSTKNEYKMVTSKDHPNKDTNHSKKECSSYKHFSATFKCIPPFLARFLLPKFYI